MRGRKRLRERETEIVRGKERQKECGRGRKRVRWWNRHGWEKRER
jgi:hypothetical protein